jgi:hypothetical protein
MMVERERLDCEAGKFPWGNYSMGGRPSDDEIRAAIAECLEENGGRHLGELRLWRGVRDKFPGDDIPRKAVRDLMPKRTPGRPRKS